MTAVFDDRGPVVTPEQVDAFEKTLPALLPQDYRAFLLGQNGGWTHLWWPPERGGFDFGVRVLYSLLGEDPVESLSAVREVFDDSLPPVFVAVGADDNGDQICLSLRERDHGTVWLYDPEREFDPSEPADPDLLRAVCSSFAELLAALEPEPSFDEVRRRTGAVQRQ